MIEFNDLDVSDLAGEPPIVPDQKPGERVEAFEHRKNDNCNRRGCEGSMGKRG